jgi:hypothetical protein
MPPPGHPGHVSLLLPVFHHVAGGGHEDAWVVLHRADAAVAAVTQQAADLPSFVIVVNPPGAPGARRCGTADRAPDVLQRQQPVVVGLGDAVQGLELDVPPVLRRAVIHAAVFADRTPGLVRYRPAAPLAWPWGCRLTVPPVLVPPILFLARR